ncbi:MAG: nucleotidyltransferase family protein, partial [Oscillospiraceae bacterium]
AMAVSEVLNDDICEILKTPNNILAIEYLKALYRTKSAITPIAIKRVGAGHDDLKSTNSFASATYIRNLISSNTAISSEFMPHDCTETFNKEATFSIKNIETSIILNICKMSLSELENISDVSEGLENRIKKLAMESKFNNIDDLASAIKSKRYAFSRIRRILLASLLNISKDDQQTLPKYIKILDFNQTGRDILNQIKKTTSLPLAKNMNGIKSDKDAVLMWKRELLFDRIYSLCKNDILLN